MKTFSLIGLVLLSSVAFLDAKNGPVADGEKKNIIFILCDDLGFNDPSFRGNNEILTPNIDALFYQGVTLNRYYTAPLCTPSRASLLTGRYTHHIGMHNEVTWNHQPWGLGLDQKIMPQYFKEVGYRTHMLGKWHLGFHQKQFTPTMRGFDTHFGILGQYADYFNFTMRVPESNFGAYALNYQLGYDFRNNLETDWTYYGQYVTDVLTMETTRLIESDDPKPFLIYLSHLAMHRANDEEPLQAKAADYDLYPHITNPDRRTYAAMLKSLDDSIGEVIASLTRSNKLKDTLIVFTSDNGGPTAIRLSHPNTASNYPLRGMKGLAWEGGIRVDCAVYAPWLPSGARRDSLFHVSDWIPTLSSLTNANIRVDRLLDGMDLSKMIMNEQGPFRKEVTTINDWYLTTSFIYNKFKLMNSSYAPTRGIPDVWLGSNNNVDHDAANYISRVLNSKAGVGLNTVATDALTEHKIQAVRASLKVTCTDKIVECKILEKPCLFNIDDDPCERINLANDPAYLEDLIDMMDKLQERIERMAPGLNRPGDFASNPALHGGIWTWWQDDAPHGFSSVGRYNDRW